MIAVAIALAASMQAAQSLERAAVRSELEQVYKKWGEARISIDKSVIENTLQHDFYVVLPDGKHTRQEFIDQVTKLREGVRVTRFDSRIITLNKADADWTAVITEKFEADIAPKNAKPFHVYSFWVTKDGWHKDADGAWRAKFSEAIGNEGWRDTKPPFGDWDR